MAPKLHSAPVLVVVEDDAELRSDLERALCDRYGRHYGIVALGVDEAATCLKKLAGRGAEVALVLTTGGPELLADVHRLHPHAKRALLIAPGKWGDPATGAAILDSVTRGRIDDYVVRPAGPADERFHGGVSSLLQEWVDVQRISADTVHVVGETWSGRAHELREVLGRCAMPHRFWLANSAEGRALRTGAAADAALPLMVFPNGRVLADPSDEEIAQASGTTVDAQGMQVDLVIVGCGPAGLSAAVYGASEGLRTLVVDSGGLGGQATLSSSIRNYLGFPRGIGGGDLARRAHAQAWIFGASFAFMQRVTRLERAPDGVHLGLAGGGRLTARAVVLAIGASYRRLGIPAVEALNGAGVFYGAAASEAATVAGKDVFVVGGANSAGQAAVHLARYARTVTLVVRAASLDAGMSHYLARQVEADPTITVRTATDVVDAAGDGWLERLELRDMSTGRQRTVDADGLFLMIGARPQTGWLPPEIVRDEHGFVLTGADLPDAPPGHHPLPMETSMPGVLAAGDARHGSVKRVASAVGDGSVAIQTAHRLLAARPTTVGHSVC
ncbi:MAG: FAD-dependent oxidoreductase [Actinomycetota bacterium]|nr:FAD-dependent oxidoreductase [Actinomycetota bacterium]